jgi:phage-related protein
MVSRAKSAASNVVNAIKNGLSAVVGKVKSIGRNLVEGLWNGINDKVGWIVDKIRSFGDKVTNKLKEIFGVASPSKVTMEIGRFLDEGLALGIENGADAPVKAMDHLATGVLDSANSLNGATMQRRLQATYSAPAAASGFGVGDKLDRILAALERGQILTIDGDTLVGATVDRIDMKLGQRRALAARGAM